MKLHLSKELKAGLIVLLIAVAMYWLVYFLKGRDIFSSVTLYRIEYENVEGVSATGPVYIRGFKVGTIKNISYNQQKDIFDVTVQLESRYQIPENSIAQIYSADLLGTKAIRIHIGNSAKMLSNNEFIPSDIATDIVGYLSKELPLLKEQISGVLTSLDSSLMNLNRILGVQNRENLENALIHLTETLRHFQKLGAWLNSEAPQIQSIVKDLKHLSATLGGSADDIGSTLSNLARFTDTLNQTNIVGVIRDIDLLINQINNNEGTVGKLLHNDEIYQSLTRLLQNVETLLFQIGQNPKKFFRISIF